MRILESNRRMPLSFVMPFDTAAFKAKLNYLENPGKDVLVWVAKAAVSVRKDTMNSIRSKLSTMKSTLEEPEFRKSEN